MEIQSNLLQGMQTQSLLSQGIGQGKAFTMGKAAGKYNESSVSFSPSGIGRAEADAFAKFVVDSIDAAGLRAEDAGADESDLLKQSLADSIDYVRENFGDEAATAMIGLVSKGMAGGEASEEALGQSLLTVVKFMDRNFGFEGGDKIMAQFNGQLNDSLNRYFENGFEEQFYAVNGPEGTFNALTSAISQTMNSVTEKYGADAAQTVVDLITKNLEENGINRTSIAKGLAEATGYLTGAFGEEAGTFASEILSPEFASVMDAFYPSNAVASKGVTLDMAV
jgi:hypothetical protein